MEKDKAALRRTDIAEQAFIENAFNIEHVKFADYIKIISHFFDETILAGQLFDRLSTKESTKNKIEMYLDEIRGYAAGENAAEVLKKLRIDAWREFDKQDGVDKALLRLVLIGLHDEKTAQYDENASSSHFEIIFSALHDVSHGLCESFSSFLMKNELMQKYKI